MSLAEEIPRQEVATPNKHRCQGGYGGSFCLRDVGVSFRMLETTGYSCDDNEHKEKVARDVDHKGKVAALKKLW